MKNVILKRYPIGNKRFGWKQKDYILSSFKCHADDYGNKYVIFVNRAFFKELKTTLKLKGKFNVYKISEVDGTQSLIAENVDSVDVSLSAGDASFLRFQNAQEEQYTIKYSLVE